MKFLEKTDPFLKLLLCFELIVMAIVFKMPISEAVLLTVIILLELANSFSLKIFKSISVILFVVCIQIFAIQLLFGREGNFIGGLWIFSAYSESMSHALAGSLRTAVLAFSAVLFCSHTESEDVTLMLVNFGLPYKYAMLPEFTARFLPVLGDDYKNICDAKTVRGEDNSTIGKKLVSLFSTFMPLIYRSLRKAEDAALSMDMRGFCMYNSRTFPPARKFFPHKGLCAVLLIAMMAITLIIKFIYFY